MGVTRGAARPPHVRWTTIGLVAIGGGAGTAARVAITLALPAMGSFPFATFAINVAGAFLLGMLLEALARRGPDVGRLRGIRLLAGTGFLGGFTTYSALATDTALLPGGAVGTALMYSMGTLLVGAAATWVGIMAGTRLTARGVGR
jgi:CrcB protein